LGGRKGIRTVKTEWWGAGVIISLERGADLHMAHLMPLPLTVSCFSKIQIGFTFLLPAHLGSLGDVHEIYLLYQQIFLLYCVQQFNAVLLHCGILKDNHLKSHTHTHARLKALHPGRPTNSVKAVKATT